MTITTSRPSSLEPGDYVVVRSLGGTFDGVYRITKVRQNLYSIVPNRWYHYPINWALHLYWKTWGLYWRLRAALVS